MAHIMLLAALLMPTRSKSLPAVLSLVVLLGASPAWADDDMGGQAPPSAPVSLAPTPMWQTHQGTGPDEIDPEVPRAPDGYTPVYRTRKRLLIAGVATLVASYGGSAMAAAVGEQFSGENPLGAMWIPIAGPFIQVLAEPQGNDTPAPAGAKAAFVGLGVAQLAGAYLLYRGLQKKRVFVRNDRIGGLELAPMAPTSANNHATGMMLGGRF
jgi:hypothetical protein